MKKRRVTVTLEIETDVTIGQLRRRECWLTWLPIRIKVMQAQANVILMKRGPYVAIAAGEDGGEVSYPGYSRVPLTTVRKSRRKS